MFAMYYHQSQVVSLKMSDHIVLYVRADAYGVMTAATKKGDSHITCCYSVCLFRLFSSNPR